MQACRLPEVMLSGPSETGKTIAALYALDTLAREHQGAQFAIVRKVRADMDGTVLQLFKQHFARVEFGVTTFGGEHTEFFDYPNGSRIWAGGMDRPGKVLSGARDGIYVNQAEELALEDWETLSTRTTGRAGVIQPGLLFGDCNPGPASHWILHRPSLKVLCSRHEDNPSLYDGAGQLTEQGARTMAVLDALTGVRYKRLRLGLWASAEGTVYQFDPALHELDALPAAAGSWRHIVAVDFGYTNPFCAQLWVVDHDGRMYLDREIYMTKRTVKAHSRTIKAWLTERRVEAVVCDHDAEDRATLEENGIPTIAARKAISVGIEKVQERLKAAGDGRPRLFVRRGALVERDEELARTHKPVCTRDEFDLYQWPKANDGRPIKDIPVDLHNHGMDPARYAAMYLDEAESVSFVMRYR